MAFPLTLDEYLRAVAKETARQSWPGRMAPVLKKGAKNDTEEFFTSDLFLAELRSVWSQGVSAYDSWHKDRVAELAVSIDGKVRKYDTGDVPTGYRPKAVAAKLLDTFMHQLMKYQECRFLWTDLHLVLDGSVFAALRVLARESTALQAVSGILVQNPYKISGEEYERVQMQLREFMAELNRRPNMEFELLSRIQLNLLWADGHRNDGCADYR